MTSEGPRGRRKSTLMGVGVVLLIVALMLAITAYATGASKLYLIALVLVAIALVAWLQARRAPHQPPPKDEP